MTKEECVKEIMQGIDMGILGIEHVEDKIEDNGLKKLVTSQKKEYESLRKKVLKDYPEVDKKKGHFMTATMLEMKTMFADDKDMVKMLMQGCNMAIISMTEVIHELSIIDINLRKIANDLEDISKRYEEELKSYL